MVVDALYAPLSFDVGYFKFSGEKMNQLAPPSENYLVIPCPQEKFAEFIAGLLGKAQTISRDMPGVLSIDRDGIKNFFELVQQRVHEQQEASLVQFTVKTSYHDGSSVEVSTIDEFMGYAEVRALIPRSVTLTWVYLIKFNGRTVPEKQQIDLSIYTANFEQDTSLIFDDPTFVTIDDRARSTRIRMRTSGQSGLISLRIAHTARTWGMDIENLLAGHARNIFSSAQYRWTAWLQAWASMLGFVGSLAAALLFISLGYRFFAYRWDQRLSEYTNISIGREDTGVILLEKVDFIAQRLTGKDTLFWFIVGVLYVAVCAFLTIGVGFFIGSSAGEKKPSFIVLSKKSEDYKEKLMSKYRNNIRTGVISFALSVISGVVGSIIFLAIGP